MDFVPWQPGGRSIHSPPSDYPSSADSTSVGSTLNASQVPGQAIGQRSCVVDQHGDIDCSDNEYHDISQDDSSDDEYFDALDQLPSACQQEAEPQDSDYPWQVVTRRRSGCKRQPSTDGKSTAKVKQGIRAGIASASRRPERPSARSGVAGQKQCLQLNGPGSLFSPTQSVYRPLCINSFARLGEVDWVSFCSLMGKFHQCLQINVTRDEFLRFHHMMTEGLRAIRGVDDIIFLVGPFKVLLSESEVSWDVAFLSLLFERQVPGFLRLLADRFVVSLRGVGYQCGELSKAISGLLGQICQEDKCSLNRLGWQELSMRHRCSLYASVIIFLKEGDNAELIRNLHRQVDGSGLEQFHYYTVKKLFGNIARPANGCLRDLRASIRGVACWLEGRFFSTTQTRERQQLIVRYAVIAESVIEVMNRLKLPTDCLLLGICQALAQSLYRFRLKLVTYLGFDRAFALLREALRHSQRWPDVMPVIIFQLRMSLLGNVLTRCEVLLHARNSNQFPQAWRQYENMLQSLLADCNRFMDKPPTLAIQLRDKWLQEGARLELLLREFKFNRLSCEIRRNSREWIQEKLEMCRIAFTRQWALNCQFLEVGTIELAKWYILAGDCEAGVRSLMKVGFKNVGLSARKADLLAHQGLYSAAVKEYHHIKALITESGETGQNRQDEVDDWIAMTYFHWYRAENNIHHLISAYRLSVDLLGRCDALYRHRYEGGLAHIVNAMKKSGLNFTDFAGRTSVLGFLVEDGCVIKSWHHFANLLYIRHKVGLTDIDTIDKVASTMRAKHGSFLDVGKKL